MTKYLLAGAFSVDTRLSSHGALVSLYEGAQEGKDVCSKLDLAMHHNSRLLDKYVTSSQQTPKLSQKEGLNDLAKIIHLTVQQARKFGTQDVLPPLY